MLCDILADLADSKNIHIHQNIYIGSINGIMVGKNILINPAVSTTYQKNTITAHEIEHYETCPFNLVEAPEGTRRKYEAIADRRTAKRLMPVSSIINLWEKGVRSLSELSDALEIDEEFICKTLNMYHNIYGYNYKYGGYVVNFMPLNIQKLEENIL